MSFKWNKPKKQIVDDYVTHGGKTSYYIAQRWHMLTNKFVPFKTGALSNRLVDVLTNKNRASIIYRTSYARRMYYGDGFNFNKTHHPLVTSRWHEAAKKAGLMKTLIENLADFLRRLNK